MTARRPLLLVAGAVVTVGLLGTGAYALTGPDVPRGTRVAGVDVGGASRAQARSALSALPVPASVPLVADGQPLSLDPSAAGLRLDLDGTLDAAQGGPLARLRALLGGTRDVRPVSTATTLDAALTGLAGQVDRPVRQGGVTYEGLTPVAVAPLAGRELQRDDARKRVLDGWLLGEPVELPVTVTPVTVDEAAVQAALDGPARDAVAAPVVLDAGGAAVTATPADLAAALTFQADGDGRLAPRVDGLALLRALGDRAAPVQQPARDAGFDVTSGVPVVVPAQEGQVLDADGLAAAVQPVVLAPAPRTASVTRAVQQPRVTTAQAEALGVKEIIGTFTTRHPCCRPRVTNIHTIADLVDGTLVLPGETYSLNGAVGVRDRARGFVAAPQISEGQFVDAVGGGISQFATTLYNATFFAGLEDVEHKPHSYYISRYPEGREATVSTPAPDLRWRNDSPHGVLVQTSYSSTSITVTLWGTKRYDEVLSRSSGRMNVKPFGVEYVDRPDCTSSSGMAGFDIVITRIMKKAGAEVARDTASHRYLPEPRFICGKPPAPPTPAVPPTPTPPVAPTPAPAPAAPAPAPTVSAG